MLLTWLQGGVKVCFIKIHLKKHFFLKKKKVFVLLVVYSVSIYN